MRAQSGVSFTKMQGLGNDFIIVDNRDLAIEDGAALARALCPRRLAAGADGLMLAEPSDRADAKMRFFNADGSEAEMCGNGIRCFARYLYDEGMVIKAAMSVETRAGIIQPALRLVGGRVAAVRVNMGLPELAPERVPVRGTGLRDEICIGGQTYALHSLRMGVPHAVVLVKNAADPKWMRLGAKIEADTEKFPERVNVNFVQVVNRGEAVIRTYERGAGPTLACGTGSCAAAVVLNHLGLAENRVKICHAPGDLEITVAPEAVYMEGPAEYVYRAVAQ